MVAVSDKICYVIPTPELSLSELVRRRKMAIAAGKARAVEVWKVDPASLTARDADYAVDFIVPFVPAANSVGLAGWVSQPFLAVGAWYSVFCTNAVAVAFQAVAPVCPTNQIWVFYKVSILTVAGPDPCSGLEFRIGRQANLKYHFDIENIYGKTECNDGYFSQIVTYANPEIATVNAQARVVLGAGVGCRVKLGTFVIETMETTLT